MWGNYGWRALRQLVNSGKGKTGLNLLGWVCEAPLCPSAVWLVKETS